MQFRQNVATREWVLFAPERGRRPDDFRRLTGERTHEQLSRRADCPFCPGNEEESTAGETLRYVDAQGHWCVRAFPNAFPAVVPHDAPRRRGDVWHHTMDAAGVHEVLAESAQHDTTLGLQSEEDVGRVLCAWRERVRALRQRSESEHVVVFKNHGSEAGSSLMHPHSQVVTLPLTPSQVRHRLMEAMRFHDDNGQCVFCSMLEVERIDRERIVVGGSHFTAFVPFAAFSPFSLWVLPSRHHCCISQSTDDELVDLAHVLRDVLGRLYQGLNDPPYNLVLRVATRNLLEVNFFHWYIAIVPRLQKSAGFEMGTGMFINTTLPESDATFLRNTAVAPPEEQSAK